MQNERFERDTLAARRNRNLMALLETHRSLDRIRPFCNLDRETHLPKAFLELGTPRGCLDAVAQTTRRLDNRTIPWAIRQSNLADEQSTWLEHTMHLGKSALRLAHEMQDTVDENHVDNRVAELCCQQIFGIGQMELHVIAGKARFLNRAIHAINCLGNMLGCPIDANGMPARAHALRQLEHALAAAATNIENGHSLESCRKRHMAKARIPEFPIHLAVVLLELTVGHRIVQTDASRERRLTHHACAIPEFAVASISRSFLRSFKSSGTMNAVVVRIDSVSANGYVKQMA